MLYRATSGHLKRLLESACQPRHSSGNSCIKLCYFIELCKKAESDDIKNVAFSMETSLDLFSFYVEWNEKNHHRSMRQVLELLASLITSNPDKAISDAIKTEILNRLFSIITHQSSQPLVKPAFKAFELFLTKGTLGVGEVIQSYSRRDLSSPTEIRPSSNEIAGNKIEIQYWDSFVSDAFDWMSLADVSSAAGKFLVSLFRELRKESAEDSTSNLPKYTLLWQRWIRNGLRDHPESLENIKNYLFPPLFKLDRPGSMAFLEGLTQEQALSNLENQDLDAQSFLLLAAMEVGKKSGLVDAISKKFR